MTTIQTSEDLRLRRCRDALAGIWIGDALGDQFFLHPHVVEEAIRDRWIPKTPWRWTDDTNMALSVYEVLAEYGTVDQNTLVTSFAHHYDPSRDYGPAMQGVFARIRDGEPWGHISRSLFGGTGSFGNGAAMRVAPIGAYFSDDLPRVVAEAARSAEVTHAHVEGIAGAIAVAVATALAAQSSGHEAPISTEFLLRVVEHVPETKVRSGLMAASNLGADTPVAAAAAVLGVGHQVAASDTVPFALWSASKGLDDFGETIWRTVSGLGDRDTTSAIAGGVVAARLGVGGIPLEWRESAEPLPEWVGMVNG